jgi:hypothetical protein
MREREHSEYGGENRIMKNEFMFAAVRFLYKRLNTYDLLTKDYKQEEQIIHNILRILLCPHRVQKFYSEMHPHTIPVEVTHEQSIIRKDTP